MLARFIQVAVVLFALAGCAQMQTGVSAGESQVRFGTITNIQSVTMEGRKFGIGTILGGVAGGVLGHQVGGGTGKDIATVVGAVAGAATGNVVERNMSQQQGQAVTVQMTDGGTVTVTQPVNPSLAVGNKVRIDGSGENARVIRQ